MDFFERSGRNLTRFQKRIGKKTGLAIELSRAIVASPHHHKEQFVLMTSGSIPGIHNRGNQYYPVLLSSSGLSTCHGGEVWRFCRLRVHPIAHQDGVGARPLCAFGAALRVPRSVLDEAVSLEIAILLQQADPVVFPRTYSTYEKRAPKGCWHTTGVTLRGLFPPLALRQRRSHCSQGLGRRGTHRDRNSARH